MIRKTITVLSLISLLLTVAAWGTSYFYLIYVHPSCKLKLLLGGVEATPVTVFEFTSDGLKLTFTGERHTRAIATETMRFHEDGKRWLFIGYRGMSTRWLPRYSPNTRRLFIPLWIPTLIFGGLLSWSLFPLLRRKRRRKLGLCLSCGYDLQSNVSGVCPECGKEVKRNS